MTFMATALAEFGRKVPEGRLKLPEIGVGASQESDKKGGRRLTPAVRVPALADASQEAARLTFASES